MIRTQSANEILGVRPYAGAKEIRLAWRRFAAQHHPDRGGDPDAFKAGLEAYSHLAGHSGPSATGAVVFYKRPKGLQVPVTWGRSRLRRFRRPKRVI